MALDGSDLILEFTIKFYRMYLSGQPIAEVRAQKRHVKNIMNAIQALALQVQAISSFADALGNLKGSAEPIAQVTAAFQRQVASRQQDLVPNVVRHIPTTCVSVFLLILLRTN